MAGFNPTRRPGVAGAQPGIATFNAYAAGNKAYGGGRPFPNSGAVGAAGTAGYNERDQRLQARRDALLRRSAMY